MSKTKQALAWLKANPGKTPYAAAKAIGLAPSTVTRALKMSAKPRCPGCGRPLH